MKKSGKQRIISIQKSGEEQKQRIMAIRRKTDEKRLRIERSEDEEERARSERARSERENLLKLERLTMELTTGGGESSAGENLLKLQRLIDENLETARLALADFHRRAKLMSEFRQRQLLQLAEIERELKLLLGEDSN